MKNTKKIKSIGNTQGITLRKREGFKLGEEVKITKVKRKLKSCKIQIQLIKNNFVDGGFEYELNNLTTNINDSKKAKCELKRILRL